MAITDTAAFTQFTKLATVNVVLATDTSVSLTNMLEIFQAGPDGALMSSLSALPLDTVTSTGLYMAIAVGGTGDPELVESVIMAANTFDATVATPKTTFSDISQSKPTRLGPSDKVFVGAGVAFTAGTTFKLEASNFSNV